MSFHTVRPSFIFRTQIKIFLMKSARFFYPPLKAINVSIIILNQDTGNTIRINISSLCALNFSMRSAAAATTRCLSASFCTRDAHKRFVPLCLGTVHVIILLHNERLLIAFFCSVLSIICCCIILIFLYFNYKTFNSF